MASEQIYTKKLLKFLESKRVKRGQRCSHYSMGAPVGNFYISGSKNLTVFYSYYEKALKEGTKLFLIEKHKKYGPILFDIDLKYNSINLNRKYNKSHIEKVVELYNKNIKKYLNVDDNLFHAFITEKPEPSISHVDVYKDGFHGIYPNIWTTPKIQHIIRSAVVKEFKENNYFGEIEPINKYDDIFDIAVIDSLGWFVYGSRKPKRQPYKLTYVIGSDQEFYDRSEFREEDLPEILSIRRLNSADLTKFNSSYTDEKINSLYKSLNIKRKKVSTSKKTSRRYSEEDFEKARTLVKMLSPDRAETFNEWVNVGFCLYNIDDSLLDNWIEFSMLSPKFIAGDCEKRWNSFHKQGYNGLGLGSLFRWAEEDNILEYDKFIQTDEDTHIRRSITGTSGEIAKSYYNINRTRFKCASIKHSSWYEFKNHRWCPVEDAYTIFLELNEKYPAKYKKVADYFYYKLQQSSGDEKKLMEMKRESALKTAEKLTTNKFKKDIIDELKRKFYDENFNSSLDENRNLLCFTNGVYDLKNNIFRDGYPEDYVSLCTNIEYQSYDEDDEHIKGVEKFFSEVQPDEDMRNYVLDFFASCLHGHTGEELFHIWTGSGSNGKSISISMFQEALGEYAKTISITLLTNKRASSNAASPEMARCKGVRFVVFQEPENDDKIHVGHMKELTGNDKITARSLFKEPIDFYPQFKSLLTCNKLPYIPSNDGGTWRRLKTVPFNMKFVDNPTEPHHKKKDRTLKQKLEHWRTAVMSILVERYKIYKTRGLIEPETVRTHTLDYQKASDIYLEFINDTLVATTNKMDRVSLKILYDEFKYWYKETHTDKKVPSKSELKLNLIDKFGKAKSYGWPYYKVKTQMEEEGIDSDEDSDNIATC